MTSVPELLGWHVTDAALVVAGFGTAWAACALGAVVRYFATLSDGKAPKFDL